LAGDQQETDAMDQTIRREIKRFEKRAETAARLRERAASLLEKAGDIEVAQKPVFDAILLKTAYAAGLDRLPLSTIVAAFATLKGASRAEGNPETFGAKLDFIPQPIGRGRDGQDVEADAATIDLVVKIGRNTAPGRFAALDEYLTWNGKDGHWSGKVSPAVLKIFEGMFEPERLIHAMQVHEFVENGSPNTSTDALDNIESATRRLDPTPAAFPAATEVDPADVHDHVGEQPTMIEPASARLATGEAMKIGGAVEGRPQVISSSNSDQAADLSSNIGTAASDAQPGAVAGCGAPPGSSSSEPSGPTPVPRSPFAGLRRRSGS
jgi:hypothetical protein